MKALRRIADWPTTIKVPMVVAAMMLAISALVTQQVLVRLSEAQERNLRSLTSVYLDGLSFSLVPYVIRDDIWEIFDRLDRGRERYAGLRAVSTIVATMENGILAASDPKRFPSQQRVPEALLDRFDGSAELVVAGRDGRAFARRVLTYEGRPVGVILAEIDIQHLLDERREVLITLIATNGALTLIFAVGGYLGIRRMVRPIGVLASRLDRGAGGRMEPISEERVRRQSSEFRRLFRGYNAMVQAFDEREALAGQLAEEEKLASLGRLASGLAHEINNPLGGLLNTVDTLRHHGHKAEVRTWAVSLLQRGLEHIRDVVRSALMTYRTDGSARNLAGADIDDLRLLIQPELRRRKLDLDWRNSVAGEVAVSAAPIRQAVLNLLLNAMAASPEGSAISLSATTKSRHLEIAIGDSGPGLHGEMKAYLQRSDGQHAPIRHDTGLGLWMVKRSVTELGGEVAVSMSPLGGTLVRIEVPFAEPEEVRDVA